jgi:8-oxo-dGTP pyrophosphatase MutT (NUDIX family)
MSANIRNPRNKRLPAVEPPTRIHPPSGRFVRLSQLGKLRECEQVAAVCYRVRNGDIEFLLVRTRGSGRWTFPKGSAEPGLSHAQAAALEAFEEAGVHGRIEETSFVRYVGRKRGDARKSAARSRKKELAVNAHLCEVLRLGCPKESNRNRTWFRVRDARVRLREGRESDEGSEFSRVIDRAVARIQRLRGASGILGGRPQDGRAKLLPPPREMPQKDALQKVQFEPSADAHGRVEQASLTAYIRWQRGIMGQSVVPAIVAHRREVLHGEILQFRPPREKKSRALGNVTSNA